MEKQEPIILKYAKELPSMKLSNIKLVISPYHLTEKRLISKFYKPISIYSIKDEGC